MRIIIEEQKYTLQREPCPFHRQVCSGCYTQYLVEGFLEEDTLERTD